MAAFDGRAFDHRLMEVKERDLELKKFYEERNHHNSEWSRLNKEVEQLNKQKNEATDKETLKSIEQKLKMKTLERDVAYSKARKALSQRWQRESELEKEELLRELTKSTNDDMKSEIQHRLQEAEKEIRKWKGWVDHFERQLNQKEGQLKKEESHSIREEALKKGYFLLKMFTSAMVGSPGVGKTLLKLLLLFKKPPPTRSSTICAEQPVAIRSVSLSKFQKYRGKWKDVSAEQLLPMIGRFIRRNMARLRKVIPEEMKEYLEQLEMFAATTSDGNISSATGSGDDSTTPTMGGASVSDAEAESTTSSEEEAAALKEMIDSIFRTLEKVIAGDDLSEDEVEELFSSIWIYFTDSGGQPQFHELLPLFINDISSLIFVSRLSDRLDDRPPDEYYKEGELVGKRACTHLTTSEQIMCLTRSLLSRSGSSRPPNVIMVGTHRDLSHQCSETIEEKNAKVLKMFGPEMKEHLIYYNHPKSLIFPVNCLNPEEQDREIARLLQLAVESAEVKEVKVPIWWFILELLIQGLASKLKKRVLSRKFCVGIAEALGFTERSFDAALAFFDELNVMKYSKALPCLVFPDSQVPVENLSDVVEEGYELKHGQSSARKGDWKLLYEKGIVTEESLSSICKHFEKGLFEAPQFVRLLEGNLVVVPLNLSDYFMPVLLDILSGEDLEKQRVFSSVATPLLFRFSHGCRRAGVFCCLVVYLMREYGWSVMSEGGELMLVARNCITFWLPSLTCFVTLIDAFYYIEAHIIQSDLVAAEACPAIRDEVLAGIDAACERLKYFSDSPHLAFYCDHPDPSGGAAASPPSREDRHAAVAKKDSCCCVCTKGPLTFRLRADHTIWLMENKQGGDYESQLYSQDEVIYKPKLRMASPTEERDVTFNSQSYPLLINEEVQENPLSLIPVKTELKEKAVQVTISKAEPTSDIPVAKANWDLPGVEVCGEMAIVVYSSHYQQITWEGFGLRLHIHEGSLPAGMEQCTLNIKASLAGQYAFPENSRLVSAVFWLRCEPTCKFTKPVTVEIQHCAKSENVDNLKMKFVRAICSQRQLPYTFKALEGDFSKFSSYGVIQVTGFSALAATQEGSEDREYCSQLFYFGQPSLCQIDFVVTWNIEAHLTAVHKEYRSSGAARRLHKLVEFESDAITLDIPEKGIIINGWEIDPLIPPVVTKKQVDNFKGGKLPPCCQLLAEVVDKTKQLPSTKHRITLKGSKQQGDFILVNLPYEGSESPAMQTFGDLEAVVIASSSAAVFPEKPTSTIGDDSFLDVEPTFAELFLLETASGKVQVIKRVAPCWYDLGILLNFDKSGTQLEIIKEKYNSDPVSCCRAMFQYWLNGNGRGPHSWRTLIKLLADSDQEVLAREHPIGGCVTVLQTSIPNVGPGALKYRDVSPSAIYQDSSDFYKKLALDCSSQQIGVDLFAFGAQFMDLSTISCISKFSSGQVSYYPDFHHKREVPRVKFEKDFRRYLTRKIGFEAVMTIRCTDGLSLHTFHGNFFVRSTDLLSLPNVNPDHGFTMNLAIDESLKDVSMACFQAALLYTSSRGERRIRVHTLSLPVSSQLSDIYAKLNIQAIAGVLGNMAVDRASSSSLGDAREALLNIVIDATKMYRSNFASSMQASQLTLPATLRLLPLFMISLLKNPAFSLNSKVSYDFRAQAMNLIKSTPLDYLTCLLYPRLYALHMLTENCMIEREDGKEELAPPILQLSSENMTRYGIFLMDYGLGLYIWVSKDAPQALIQKIFGVPHFGAIPEIMTCLPQEENDISPLVNKLIKQIRACRQIYMPLQVIREDGPHRLLFIDKMIDDRTDYGTSYYEFLTHVSQQLSK